MSTADQTVLIVGQRPDPHIDTVEAQLEKAGASVLVLDRNSGDTCALVPGYGLHAGWVSVRGDRTLLSDITSVWWRVKPSVPAEFSGGTATVEEALKWAEWRNFLRSLPYFLTHARWVNPVSRNYEAAYKPMQLSLASEIGFDIPDTLVTNDANEVLTLFERNDRVIYKTLSSFLIPPDEMIFTNEVTPQLIRDEAAAISLAPGIFQGYVEKDHELRVTVVDEIVFAIKIDSQAREQTTVDWRHSQMVDMYVVTKLNDEDERRLLSLHARLGLIYAAYDFIVRPDGVLVFVECNPGGQWLWLEHAVDLPISSVLTSSIMKSGCASEQPPDRRGAHGDG